MYPSARVSAIVHGSWENLRYKIAKHMKLQAPEYKFSRVFIGCDKVHYLGPHSVGICVKVYMEIRVRKLMDAISFVTLLVSSFGFYFSG